MILVSAFAHPVAAVSAATVLAQSPPMPSDPQFGSRRNQDEPFDAKLERERLKAMNKERYENLKKDTDKLLKLATELKESVDKANKDMLSLEVIRKTEEVEKLAKAVREKMKAN
ncbi:MAG TPA: hypothetical protein VMZ25_06575 [Terriglobales bacterium]|nr:hypothetical protein [Terriglobales bacterium]